MRIVSIILMVVYSLNAIGLIGAIFLGEPAGGGATLAGQFAAVVLSVITILALAGKGGKPARSGAFVFAGLLLLLGVISTASWIWLLSPGAADSVFELVAAIAFMIVGGSTIAVLRGGSSTGESPQPSESESA